MYGVTKAADIALCRSLAAEWGPDNVRINCIAPGLVKTEFARHLVDGEGEAVGNGADVIFEHRILPGRSDRSGTPLSASVLIASMSRTATSRRHATPTCCAIGGVSGNSRVVATDQRGGRIRCCATTIGTNATRIRNATRALRARTRLMGIGGDYIQPAEVAVRGQVRDHAGLTAKAFDRSDRKCQGHPVRR